MGLIQRLKKLIFGENVVWEDERGGITHRYVFHPDQYRDYRAQIYYDPPTISYYLTEFSYPKMYDHDVLKGEENLLTYLFLVEDTIHELTHWAVLDNSPYTNDGGLHSVNWRDVIYPELEYVHDGDIRILHGIGKERINERLSVREKS